MLMGGPEAKRKDSPISIAKQWSDKLNRYREPKGEEVIGITWASVVFPTRIHQWTIRHKGESDKMRRPQAMQEPTNESAEIIFLNQPRSAPLESCE
jgi:hypothetical protein